MYRLLVGQALPVIHEAPSGPGRLYMAFGKRRGRIINRQHVQENIRKTRVSENIDISE